MFPIGGKLVPLLREATTPETPPANLQSPFEYTYGTSMFDYFIENVEHKKAFDLWMSSRRAGIKREWFDIYPIESQLLAGSDRHSASVFLVDVAGGKGHDISSLRTRFPDLPGRLVLQDLPRTFEDLPRPVDIEVMPHDLFTEQPIKGWYIWVGSITFGQEWHANHTQAHAPTSSALSSTIGLTVAVGTSSPIRPTR